MDRDRRQGRYPRVEREAKQGGNPRVDRDGRQGRNLRAEREAQQRRYSGRQQRAAGDRMQSEARNPSISSDKRTRAADTRRAARQQEAARVRERVLDERRRERAAGIQRQKPNRDQVSQAIEQQRLLDEQRKLEEQRRLQQQRETSRNGRGFRRRRNPRDPQDLPTERLDPVEQARLLEEAGYDHSWDLTEFETETAAPTDIETHATPPAESETATETVAETTATKTETAAETAAATDAHTDTDPIAQSTEPQITRVPVERKVIVVRAPRGWARIVLAAVEVAVISWAVLVAVALLAFLMTAQNPWMLETDWNAAMSIGADIWAMSLGAPIVAGGATVRMIPLGLTVLHILLARAGLRRARAESWQGSALFIPAYVLTVIVLMLVMSVHAHKGWLILGALLVSTLAWVWSLRSWEWDPQWLTKAGPYLRGVRDGLIATSSLAILGLVVAVVGTIAGWSRVLGIQDLLNASTFDLVIAWIAQALYLPNIAAWGASWLTGPGFYTASDAIVTPSRADVTAIPAIPLMGALPQTEVGIWVVLIPLAAGLALGGFMIWKRRETSLTHHLIHAGFVALTMLVLVAIWMWLSTGSLGGERMSLLGPRWIYATVFSTLEGGLSAALIYALAHPLLLAKYVEGGRYAKASTLSAVGSASEKLQARRGKSSGDEDESAIAVDSDGCDAAVEEADPDAPVDEAASDDLELDTPADEVEDTTQRFRPEVAADSTDDANAVETTDGVDTTIAVETMDSDGAADRSDAAGVSEAMNSAGATGAERTEQREQELAEQNTPALAPDELDVDESGAESQTDTGQIAQTDTGRGPQADTGDEPETDTGQETQTNTSDEPQIDTGQATQTDTGREPQADAGGEPEADTGNEPETNTGPTPSPKESQDDQSRH
ncbi:MAG: DUF6350 family protein [Actinomycetaceae bacterium]|nr:DUF6350 family protein [Actinomycetaceae bacterium]